MLGPPNATADSRRPDRTPDKASAESNPLALLFALSKLVWLTLLVRKDTRGFYDAFSQEYDTLVKGQPRAADIGRFCAEYILERHLDVRRMLELGCGTGLYSQELSGLAATLFGIDFSFPQLRRARARALSIVLTQADVLRLPFPDDTFDAVTSYQVLPHFPGRESQFFTEAFRVLSPGGVFLLDPAASWVPAPSGELTRSAVGALVRMTLLRATRITAWTAVPTRSSLVGALESSGFETELHERRYRRPWVFITGTKPR